MKKLLIVLAILVLLGGGGVVALVVYFVGSVSGELKPQVASFLQGAYSGQSYEAFSAELKKVKSRDDFLSDMKDCREVLGEFVEVGSMKGFHRQVTGGVSTGEITVSLKYAKGETAGKFKFVKQDGGWKLLAYHVEFPAELVPKADPAAVEPRIDAMLRLYNAADWDSMHAEFSSGLKESWPAEKFKSDLGGAHKSLGKIVTSASGGSEKDAEGNLTLVRDAEFESGKKGAFKFKYHWRLVRWELSGFWINAK
jgi:hypothetical protein